LHNPSFIAVVLSAYMQSKKLLESSSPAMLAEHGLNVDVNELIFDQNDKCVYCGKKRANTESTSGRKLAVLHLDGCRSKDIIEGVRDESEQGLLRVGCMVAVHALDNEQVLSLFIQEQPSLMKMDVRDAIYELGEAYNDPSIIVTVPDFMRTVLLLEVIRETKLRLGRDFREGG
jgi:hypothetical protein